MSLSSLASIVLSIYLLVCNFGTAWCSLYSPLARQIAAKRQLEILVNNFANKTTTGFIEQNPSLIITNAKSGVGLVKLGRANFNSTPLSIKRTGRDLDLAIEGRGFFKLKLANTVAYSLDGAMYPDAEGILVNKDGLPFLSADGSTISVPSEAIGFRVSTSGTIIAKLKDGQEDVGQVGVFVPLDFSSIKALSGSLYSFSSGCKEAENYKIINSALVVSNVQTASIAAQISQQEAAIEESTKLISNSLQLSRSALDMLSR